jgi:hypothetical protein
MSDNDTNNAPAAAFPVGAAAFSSWLPPRLQAIGQGAQAINLTRLY